MSEFIFKLFLGLSSFSIAQAQKSTDRCNLSTSYGTLSTLTVSSQAQLDPILSCGTFNGNIFINNDYHDDTVNMDGLKNITGYINGRSPYVKTIQACDLVDIVGGFAYSDGAGLTCVDFPSLLHSGPVNLENTALTELPFLENLLTLTSLFVQTSAITSLSVPKITTLVALGVHDNPDLGNLCMSSLESGFSEIQIAGVPGANLEVSFPKLREIDSRIQAEFHTISSLFAPQLESVHGVLEFSGATVENLFLSRLAAVNGSLSIVNDQDSQFVSLPSLRTLGSGLDISNNSALSFVDFPLLETVSQGIFMVGDFAGPCFRPLFPSLESASYYSIQSTNEFFSCPMLATEYELQNLTTRSGSIECNNAAYDI